MMISIWHLAWIIPLVIILAFGFFALCVWLEAKGTVIGDGGCVS